MKGTTIKHKKTQMYVTISSYGFDFVKLVNGRILLKI